MLNYLHTLENPVIFRNVKPANIMLTKRGKIYLIDFGIARHYRAEQKKDTGPLGSPGYAAPEQYGKAQSGPRTDLYGLGATLQTLLTGKEPGESQPDSIQLPTPIVAEFQALIARMMNPDPEQRPTDMLEIKKELEKIQKKSVNLGCSLVSIWLLSMSFVSSMPFFFDDISLGLTMFIFGLITILGISGWQFYKAKRETPGKLSKEHWSIILQKGLTYSSLLLAYLYVGLWYTEYGRLSQGFSPIKLTTLLVNILLVIGGSIAVLQINHLPSFKLPRKKQNPPQDQQIMQPMVIKQRTRK